MTDHEKTIAIAPLVLTNRRFFRFFGLRQIGFLASDIVHGEYLDFIIDSRSDRPQALRAICDYLERHSNEWDIMRLNDIREDSGNIHCVGDIARSRKYRFVQTNLGVRPYVVLPQSWQCLQSSLKKKLRKNFQYQKRRLDRLGATFCLHDRQGIEADLEAFWRLHEKRWKSKGQPGAFVDQRKRRFYRSIAVLFSEVDWLRLWFIRADHRPIAALFGFQYKNRFHYLQSGFDPEWTKYSVGQVLLACVFENAIAEGALEFDFLRGAEPYKYDWGAVDKISVGLEISRQNAKTFVFHAIAALRRKLRWSMFS